MNEYLLYIFNNDLTIMISKKSCTIQNGYYIGFPIRMLHLQDIIETHFNNIIKINYKNIFSKRKDQYAQVQDVIFNAIKRNKDTIRFKVCYKKSELKKE